MKGDPLNSKYLTRLPTAVFHLHHIMIHQRQRDLNAFLPGMEGQPSQKQRQSGAGTASPNQHDMETTHVSQEYPISRFHRQGVHQELPPSTAGI